MKDFCLSSYMAFRYIWKDGMDFYPGFTHHNFQPVSDEERRPVTTAADIDREIQQQMDALYQQYDNIGICSQEEWTAPTWLPTSSQVAMPTHSFRLLVYSMKT